MPAFDLTARITGWALDEAQRQSFTDQVGVAVSMRLQAAATRAGIMQQAEWVIVLTLPTGLVGRAPLVAPVRIGAAQPGEKDVRAAVTAGLEQLRQSRTALRAPSNGHGTLPGGLVAGRG